jgi:hypothetical protein
MIQHHRTSGSLTNPTHGTEDYLVVELTWTVELSQERIGQPFEATLIRQETRWFDGDPTPDVVESTEASCQTASQLAAALTMVDHWLLTAHQMRILPQSWQSRPCGGTTGLTVLLEGRAATALPTAAIKACNNHTSDPNPPAYPHPLAS